MTARDSITRARARTPGVVVIPLHGGARSNPRPGSVRDNRWITRMYEGWMQTGQHAANVGSRLKLAWKSGRRHLKSQPSSRIGENPPYGMIGGIEETSASFEARSAPRSYPTDPHRPRVMRSCPRGFRRSVDRGAHRPAIEPRKIPILGADTV